MMGLAAIDIAIIAVYFLLMLGVGMYFGRSKKNADEYIVGGRNIPWFAVLGSIVATEVSAATFIGLPGVAFTSDMSYLQMAIGSIFGRILIAFVFLGAFYTANCLSIYQYLNARFGRNTQMAGAGLFIVTRLIASGMRLLIATTGVHLILGVEFFPCLIVFTLISLAYTGSGGIKAVIYTDCIQAVVFITGGLCVLFYLLNQIGLDSILELGSAGGRFHIFNFAPQDEKFSAWFNDSSLLYIALAFGFLNTAAALGTDQDLTQRMLTCRRVGDARRSVIISGFISLLIVALFLFVGASVFAYYQVNGVDGLPMNGDKINSNQIFAHFIAHDLPAGLKGILLVGAFAAAMSSLDSAMAALSSSVVMDFIKPIIKKEKTEAEWVKLSRIMVAVFALTLVLIAWSLKDVEQSFVWLSFKIAGIPYSILLGIFLLGTLTKRGSDRSNMIIMVSGIILLGVGLRMVETGEWSIAWQWVLFFGTIWSFGLGALIKPSEKPSTL